jgi:hypothetical protein
MTVERAPTDLFRLSRWPRLSGIFPALPGKRDIAATYDLHRVQIMSSQGDRR